MPPRSRDSQESRKKDASAGLRGIRGHHVILITCFFIAVGGMAVFHSSSHEQDDVYGTLLQGRGRARPSVVSTTLHLESGEHGGGGRPGPPNASAPGSKPWSTGGVKDEGKHVGDVAVVDESGAAVKNGQHGREGARDMGHGGKGGEGQKGTKRRVGKKEGEEGGRGRRRGRGAEGDRDGKERVVEKDNGNIGEDHDEHDLAASNKKEKEKEREREREREKESKAPKPGTKAHDKVDVPESAPAAPKPLAPAKTTSGSAAATSNSVGGGVLKGGDGVIADEEWNHLMREAKVASPSGKVILTSVYSDELEFVVNFLVRLDSAQLVISSTGRNMLFIAMDEKMLKTLQNMNVPCFLAGAPTVPRSKRVAVEVRGTLQLLRGGVDVIWTDVTSVWTWDVGHTWLRATPARVDVASPLCGDKEICRSLVLTRSNSRTIQFMTEAVSLASEGEGAGAGGGEHWQDKGMGVASLIKTWGDKGRVTWTRDLMSVSEGVPGDSLVVMSMSKAQFGVIGVHGEWEQLTNSALVWLHKNSATRDAGTLLQMMKNDGVYLLADNWMDMGGNPANFICTALSSERVAALGRHSPTSQFLASCESRGLVKSHDASTSKKEARAKGRQHKDDKRVKGSGRMTHLDGIGPAYTFLKSDEQANLAVVMQLSQGRAGSTVTGNMMLRSHPYCGMYFDELTWGIYRTKMAPEPVAGDAANNTADFDKVLDVYFNSTQCIMPTRLFGDGRQGQPGAVAAWLGKRDRFGMGMKSRGKDYFKLESQAAECSKQARLSPRRAVCGKELKFMGAVKELLAGAQARGVRFSLLYLLRDPRGNALSQLYAFSPKWFSEYSSPMTEVLKEHCRIAAIDVAAMNDFSSGQASADGVEATQICFEDFKDRPQGALSDLYSTFGPFRRWYEQQPSDGRSKIVPEEVEEFGKEHIANWEVNGSSSRKAALPKPVLYGQVPVGFDHHYSTDLSRIVHVDSWRDVYVRDERMKKVWQEDSNCKRLREISKCAKHWPDLDDYVPTVKDKPISEISPGTAGNDKHRR